MSTRTLIVGETVISVGYTFAVTVTVISSYFSLSAVEVALIFTEPEPTPVTRPSFTVATLSFSVDHVTLLDTSPSVVTVAES